MVRLEWGAKHLCTSCGAKFYDLQRDPIVCPKCRTVRTPEESLKARNASPAKPKARSQAPAEAKGPATAAEDAEPETAAADIADKGENSVEDASELGQKNDQVAQVVDTVDDKAR